MHSIQQKMDAFKGRKVLQHFEGTSLKVPEKTLLMKLSGHDLYRDGVLWVMQLSKCLNFVREDLVKIHSFVE